MSDMILNELLSIDNKNLKDEFVSMRKQLSRLVNLEDMNKTISKQIKYVSDVVTAYEKVGRLEDRDKFLRQALPEIHRVISILRTPFHNLAA